MIRLHPVEFDFLNQMVAVFRFAAIFYTFGTRGRHLSHVDFLSCNYLILYTHGLFARCGLRGTDLCSSGNGSHQVLHV